MADKKEDESALWALTVGFDKYAYRAIEQVADQLSDLETALLLHLTRFFRDFEDDDDVTVETIAYLLYSLREELSETAKLDDVISAAMEAQIEDLLEESVSDLQRHFYYLADDDVDVWAIAAIAAVLESVKTDAIHRTQGYALTHPQQLLQSIRSTVAGTIGQPMGAVRRQLSKELPQVFKSALSRADRLIVTEAAGAYSIAYKQSAIAVAQSGVLPPEVTVYYRWDALRDSKTCSLCRSLDGKIVGVSESYDTIRKGEYESYMYPPSHSRCRCAIFIVLSRDEADGRTTTRDALGF